MIIITEKLNMNNYALWVAIIWVYGQLEHLNTQGFKIS